MSRYAADRGHRLDPDSFAGGYFRHAVYNHWDPYEDVADADVAADRRKLLEAEVTEAEFDEFRTALALFGAGEEAVTEDLAPLMLVLEDVNDQLFVASQVYEEAKHAQFFDRYWREVVDPVAEEQGFEVTAPTDDRYFPPGYVSLFDATEDAMHRLLEEDTPENRVRAYCHYHLVVESVLAQTGYYGLTSTFDSERGSDEVSTREADDLEAERLDALVEGVNLVRSDEGRHVGFGMAKIRGHVQEDGVDPDLVRDTLNERLADVAGILQHTSGVATDPGPLVEYARDKVNRRIEVITEAEAELPPVEELVALEDAPAD